MKRHRRLRRLRPNAELVRRRATGETFRELAPNYGVSHTTLSRYCARPEVATQLRQGAQRLRAEQPAAAASRKRDRRLRRLTPDAELFRRRAAGETLRQLAPTYGVSHTTLSRFFARPQAGKELTQAGRNHRAEQRATKARLRAEREAEREARRLAKQQAVATPVSEQRPRLGRIIRPTGGFNW